MSIKITPGALGKQTAQRTNLGQQEGTGIGGGLTPKINRLGKTTKANRGKDVGVLPTGLEDRTPTTGTILRRER